MTRPWREGATHQHGVVWVTQAAASGRTIATPQFPGVRAQRDAHCRAFHAA